MQQQSVYNQDANQVLAANLDNRNEAGVSPTDIFRQMGESMYNAFINTLVGGQHLRGTNASEIAQKAYLMGMSQSQPQLRRAPTFAQWADEYMEVYETGCTDETKRKLWVYLNKHLIPAFGPTPIDQITQTDVQRFANRKAAEKSSVTGRPYAHKTLKHLLSFMKKILDRAEIAGYIQKNPVVKIKNNAQPAPRRIGSTEDAQGTMIRILPTIADEQVRLWATISLSSGMRAQEIAALKWEDVDWKLGCFNITEAVCWHNSTPSIKSTKTEAGVRMIPFQDWAAAILKPLALQSGYILRPKKGVTDGTRPVGLSTYRSLANKFEVILAQYGLPRYTAHVGRHTMANTLDKVGASSKSIERISGHTDADFTRSQYMNAELEQTRRDMQKVSEFNKLLVQQSVKKMSDAKYPK